MKTLLFLPAMPIYTPHWADTRESRSVIRFHSSGLEAALGEQRALVGMDTHRGLRTTLGLEAAAFMGFDPKGELTFSLLTFDGIFGLPLDLEWRDWSARLEWTHWSAHFADGVRQEESLPDPELTGSFSREWLGLTVARSMAWFRPYLAAQWIVHSTDGGDGVTLQAGTSVDARSSPGLYAGLELQSRQEQDWALSGAAELGVQWFESGGGLQLGLCAYSGMDDAGKRAGKSEQYVGLSLGIRPPTSIR